MNKEIIFFILSVIYFISSKRYVTDYYIKKIIRIIRLLKAFYLDICIWI